MSGVTKVFASAFAGTFLAAFAAPKITAALPESLKTPTAAKLVGASISGGAAVACYYLIGAIAK